MRKLLLLLVFLFLTLQILDMATTVYGVSLGALEGNTLAKLITGYSVTTYIIIKTSYISLSGFMLWLGYYLFTKKWSWEKIYLVMLAANVVYMGYVVAVNLYVIWRLLP